MKTNDIIEINYNENDKLIWKRNNNIIYRLNVKQILKNAKYYFVISLENHSKKLRIQLI